MILIGKLNLISKPVVEFIMARMHATSFLAASVLPPVTLSSLADVPLGWMII